MKVKYKNLEAERIRRGVTIPDMAKTLGKSYSGVRKKLTGKASIKLDEAFLIRNTYFPNESLEYLFSVE